VPESRADVRSESRDGSGSGSRSGSRGGSEEGDGGGRPRAAFGSLADRSRAADTPTPPRPSPERRDPLHDLLAAPPTGPAEPTAGAGTAAAAAAGAAWAAAGSGGGDGSTAQATLQGVDDSMDRSFVQSVEASGGEGSGKKSSPKKGSLVGWVKRGGKKKGSSPRAGAVNAADGRHSPAEEAEGEARAVEKKDQKRSGSFKGLFGKSRK
jgi:hypothetical protein